MTWYSIKQEVMYEYCMVHNHVRYSRLKEEATLQCITGIEPNHGRYTGNIGRETPGYLSRRREMCARRIDELETVREIVLEAGDKIDR
jgi:hypothetical protein